MRWLVLMLLLFGLAASPAMAEDESEGTVETVEVTRTPEDEIAEQVAVEAYEHPERFESSTLAEEETEMEPEDETAGGPAPVVASASSPVHRRHHRHHRRHHRHRLVAWCGWVRC